MSKPHPIRRANLIMFTGPSVGLSRARAPYLGNKRFFAMQQSVWVVIGEGNAVIRESLPAVVNLQADMEVVAKAANTSEALAQCQVTKPDVVLMDLKMSKMDGLEAIATIQEKLPDTAIIVLITSGGGELATKGIKAGARR